MILIEKKCLILPWLSKIAGNFKNESFYIKKDIPKVWQCENALSWSNSRLNIFFSTPPCIEITGTLNFKPSEITENERNLKFLLRFLTLSNPLNIIMVSKICVYCELENYPHASKMTKGVILFGY